MIRGIFTISQGYRGIFAKILFFFTITYLYDKRLDPRSYGKKLAFRLRRNNDILLNDRHN